MSNLVTLYQAQNREVINANVKLKERITFLEAVITKLQDENQQLRLDQLKYHYNGNNCSSSDSSSSSGSGSSPDTCPPDQRSSKKRKTHPTRLTSSLSSSSSSDITAITAQVATKTTKTAAVSKRGPRSTAKRTTGTRNATFLLAVELSKREIPKIENNNTTSSPSTAGTRKRRQCTRKPVNYALPSIRSKLRKGDPFTFGNTTITE